jgi:arabinogalactan oligomer / maltooligosaccharide transport system substrate-binding protein
MRRVFLGLSTTMAGLLALTACSGGGGETASTDSGSVVFWDTSGTNEAPAWKRLAEKCATEGNFKVSVETVSFDQALNNYKTAAQSGQGPDVLRAEVAWVPQLARNGLIVDLAETSLNTSAGDFLPAAYGSTQYEGKTYGVPQVTDTLALLYNKKVLADAGVQPPKTWDELKSIAPKLGNEKAFFLNNDAYYALPFIYGEGGDLLNTQEKKITVNSTESVRGVQTAKGLVDAKAAQTALDQANAYNNMKAAFTAGQVAMIIDGPWVIVDLLKGQAFTDPSNLGIAELPGATAGKGSGPVGGHDYVIRQGTQAKQSSAKLIDCMSNTAGQASIAKELGLLPARKSAYDEADVKSQSTVSAFRPLVEKAHGRAWIPEGQQLFDPLKISYADVLAGKKDAKAAMDEVAKTYKDTIVTDYAQG